MCICDNNSKKSLKSRVSTTGLNYLPTFQVYLHFYQGTLTCETDIQCVNDIKNSKTVDVKNK